MADLNEHTLRTELKAAVEGRPAIIQKLQELYHGAPRGSTLNSEVRTHNIVAIMADDVTLETVQREAKRLNALLIKGDHTKAYIKELKLLEANLRAEVDVIIRHAAELGEALTPETINTISNEVRAAAKVAHVEAARALLGEFTTFKAGFTEATSHIIKLAEERADLHVDLAKLVGSEEANKIVAAIKEGTLDATKLDAPVAELANKMILNAKKAASLVEIRASGMIRISGKIESNTKLMGEYSAHIDTELSKAKSAISAIEGDIPGRLQAVDSIRAQQAAKATAKAADTARQAENAIVNKFQGTYKAVGDKLITVGKTKKLHEASLIKLVGTERAGQLVESVYTHGNGLEIFSKESDAVKAILEQMISHKPVVDDLLKEQHTLHEAIKGALPAERAEQVIAENTGRIAKAVEGFCTGVIAKAAETFNAGKSAAEAAEQAAAKAKLIGTHMSELFDSHLKLSEAQKDYQTARDSVSPKLLKAYNEALAKVPAEVTGVAREIEAWKGVKALKGLSNAFKSEIQAVTGKLGTLHNIESGIIHLEGLVVEASHGKESKEVVGLIAKVEELAGVAAHEHVKPERLAEIRAGLTEITAFDGAHATLVKLSDDTHGLIRTAAEALNKGEKVVTDVAKEGKGNMKWIIGGAVGAAVVGGLALLSGDKPRQRYTDRLNEQQGTVARGA